MLSREISVSSNLVSYREREASQIPGNSNFVWSVSWKLLNETRIQSLLSYHISAHLFLRLHLLNILVRLLAYFCFCAMLFSVSHSSTVNILCCLYYMPGVFLKSHILCLRCVCCLLFSKTRQIDQYLFRFLQVF